MFDWIEGRQNSGYFKMPLFLSSFFRVDCYLLKFKQGSHVPEHLDPVDSGKHYRLNIILKGAVGGEVKFAEKPILLGKRFHLFRPDIVKHSMAEVEAGTLYILSIGKIL